MIIEIQRTLYTTLSGSTTLANLLANAVGLDGQTINLPAIYDRPPQPVFAEDFDYFPYVTIGDNTSSEFDTDDSNGFDSQCFIYTYTREGGRAQNIAIQQVIYNLLHKADLTMNAGHAVMIYQTQMRVDVDPDGKTYQGAQTFRFVTEQ